jgi:hypothetical protein
VGSAHQWCVSYLTGRSQFLRFGNSSSQPTTLECEVPQGSFLGSILFPLYTADLQAINQQHSLMPHLMTIRFTQAVSLVWNDGIV